MKTSNSIERLKLFYRETAAKNYLTNDDLDDLFLSDVEDLKKPPNKGPTITPTVKPAATTAPKPPKPAATIKPPVSPPANTTTIKTEPKPVTVKPVENRPPKDTGKLPNHVSPVKPPKQAEVVPDPISEDVDLKIDIPDLDTSFKSFLKFSTAIIVARIRGDGHKFEQPFYIKSLVEGWLTKSKTLLSALKLPQDKRSLRPTDRDLTSLLTLFNNGDTGTRYLELCEKLGTFLFTTKEQINTNIDIDKTYVDMYTNVYVQLRKWSDNSWKNLNNKLASIHDGNLLRYVNESTNGSTDTTAVSSEQKPLALELMKVVKQLTGRDKSYQILPDERTDLQNTTNVQRKDLYARYLSVNNQVRTIFKQKLKDVIRSSGKENLPIDEVRRILKTKGVIIDYMPEGFIGGRIDENCNLYTKEGRKINGCKGNEKLVVEMNPKYNPDDDNTYVFSASGNGRAGKTGYWTVDYKQESDEEKFELVKILIDNLPAYRKIWMSDFKERGDWTEERIIAGMVELTYHYQLRIGDPNNKTDDEDTYGLTTLQIKHIKTIGENKIILDFIGKSGVSQTYTIDGSLNEDQMRLVKFIKYLMKGKNDPDSWLFTSDRKRITASKVNSYIKNRLGYPGSHHKFRHAKGTKMAMDILKNANFEPEGNTIAKKQKSAEDWIKQNLFVKVAQALGHKKQTGEELWSTSAKSYVAPELSHKFFKDLGLRSPNWIPK